MSVYNQINKRSTKHGHRYLWTPHPVRHTRAVNIEVFDGAASNREGCGNSTGCDNADARSVGHATERKEHADADTACSLQRPGDDSDEPLSHTGQCQEEEDKTLDKDCGQGDSVGNGASTTDADNLVCEVGIEAHARTVILLDTFNKTFGIRWGNLRQSDGHVGEEAKGHGGKAGDDCSGCYKISVQFYNNVRESYRLFAGT